MLSYVRNSLSWGTGRGVPDCFSIRVTRYLVTLMGGNANRCPQLGDACVTRADAPGGGTVRGPPQNPQGGTAWWGTSWLWDDGRDVSAQLPFQTDVGPCETSKGPFLSVLPVIATVTLCDPVTPFFRQCGFLVPGQLLFGCWTHSRCWWVFPGSLHRLLVPCNWGKLKCNVQY